MTTLTTATNRTDTPDPVVAGMVRFAVNFIDEAEKAGRSADVAWGNGALDALKGRDAKGEAFGSNHRHYLAGWLKVHGI